MASYRLTVERGYAGSIEFDFGEDVSAASGTFTVYAEGAEPDTDSGVSGTPLWSKTLTAGSTSTRLACTVTVTDTGEAGAYYMRGTRTRGSVVEPWHGTLVVAGR